MEAAAMATSDRRPESAPDASATRLQDGGDAPFRFVGHSIDGGAWGS